MDENEQMMSQRQENEEEQAPVPEETMQIDTTAPKKPTPEEMKFLRSMREENTEIPVDEADIDDSELVNKLDK